MLDTNQSEDVTTPNVPMDTLVELMHTRFIVSSEYTSMESKAEAQQRLLLTILERNMIPFYEHLVAQHGRFETTLIPEEELERMRDANQQKCDALQEKLRDAKENFGDVEIRDAQLAFVKHYTDIGDFCAFCKALEEMKQMKILASTGSRVDLLLQRFRVSLACCSPSQASAALTELEEDLELMKRCDWERRNRLRVYKGVYALIVRDLKGAAEHFVSSLSTFAATELLTHDEYALLVSVSALSTCTRAELKAKVFNAPELRAAQIPEVHQLMDAMERCNYREVFPALIGLCHNVMRQNIYLAPHVDFVFREIRIRVFNQYLESYMSVTLSSMADTFRLPVAVLDQMLYTLISNERLACRIDRVSGNIVTFRGNNLNTQYHTLLRDSDLLLSRLQKLSRVIEQ